MYTFSICLSYFVVISVSLLTTFHCQYFCYKHSVMPLKRDTRNVAEKQTLAPRYSHGSVCCDLEKDALPGNDLGVQTLGEWLIESACKPQLVISTICSVGTNMSQDDMEQTESEIGTVLL